MRKHELYPEYRDLFEYWSYSNKGTKTRIAFIEKIELSVP